MTDKEVGELWREASKGWKLTGLDFTSTNDCPADGSHEWCHDCAGEIVTRHREKELALIRKLVDERVAVYKAKRRTQGLGVEEETRKALRDFGIDPKDYS